MSALAGKVCVITGAGSGIGRATALEAARAGAVVHLADIDAARAGAVRDAIGQGAFSYRVDCADAEAVQGLADEVYARHGRVDLLHNNAGVVLGGAVQDLSLADWRWVVDVNLWGVIHGVHAFVPRMIEQGGGAHIVNTASMAGLVGLPYVAPYTATKFAIVGLSESLSAELAPHGIRVTAVCPGAVRTELMRDGRLALPGAWGERITRAVDRFATSPERIAREIVAAVRDGRSLLVPGGEMTPLWLLKRASPALFQRATRLVTRGLLRKNQGPL